MTVYVDDMEAPFRGMIMCHMIADTEAELHAMAGKLGLARAWHQGDHYDLAKAKRAKAVAAGAREITMRQLACMAALRRFGQPMGAPDTSIDRMLAFRAKRREAAA